MITGHREPSEAAAVVLKRGARAAIMKLGENGCAVYTCDREILCPGFAVDAQDTTGAGDCFAAGFLAASLEGATLAEAGHFANAVAAMSVQQIGAVSGVVSIDETRTWIKSTLLRQ